MTHRTWKGLLLALSSLTIGFAAGCGTGLKVKVYYLDAEQGGLVRKQTGEVIPFTQATGYYCLSPADMEAVVNALKACKK